ncbi:MAG: hypothetical protein E7Z93_05490 [Cyanobacteria bacterium SIG32]|nr:hypothetical protein [Cyanobacteria bacterium SIG32]
MGKNSKPSYSKGTVSVNGNTVASNYKKGNTVVSNYNMPETEKGIYDYAQNALLNSLPQVNVFSPETRNDINSQVEAYKNKSMQTIYDTYNPMLEDLKTDIASRFGNLNNSVFFDNLNSIENNRANAMSDLAQDVEAKRNDLFNDELSKRYNYLNLMNTLQNMINSNAINYMNMAQGNSSSGNSYNQANNTANANNTQSNINNILQAVALAAQFAKYM